MSSADNKKTMDNIAIGYNKTQIPFEVETGVTKTIIWKKFNIYDEVYDGYMAAKNYYNQFNKRHIENYKKINEILEEVWNFGSY